MTPENTNNNDETLSTGDWIMGVVAFFLTPIVSIILAIYNFSRSRKKQGKLYLSVLGIQLLIGLLLSIR